MHITQQRMMTPPAQQWTTSSRGFGCGACLFALVSCAAAPVVAVMGRALCV
jgi:hypothetical protein